MNDMYDGNAFYIINIDELPVISSISRGDRIVFNTLKRLKISTGIHIYRTSQSDIDWRFFVESFNKLLELNYICKVIINDSILKKIKDMQILL